MSLTVLGQSKAAQNWTTKIRATFFPSFLLSLIIIIIIKRISRVPIYHTRWEHRALYNKCGAFHGALRPQKPYGLLRTGDEWVREQEPSLPPPLHTTPELWLELLPRPYAIHPRTRRCVGDTSIGSYRFRASLTLFDIVSLMDGVLRNNHPRDPAAFHLSKSRDR